MKRIILLLMMLSVSSFATTYELLVNTPQEVDMYTALFNAIHFFFYGNNQDNYFSLLRLIVIFGAILTVIKATAAAAEAATSGGSSGFGSIASIAAYQVFVVFMLTTMFGKTANIVVRHPESLTVNVTPLIPDIFAYTISFFTRLNYSMTRLAEGTFSSLRGQDASRIYSSDTYMENPTYGMTGLGFAGMANALMNVNSTNLNDLKLSDGSTIQDVARSYMKDCVLMPLAASNPDEVQKVLNSKKFFDEISPANMNANHSVQTATLMMKYGSNDYITCQEGYDKMTAFIAQLKQNFPKKEYKKLAGIYYANLINQGDFSSGTFQTSGTTTALISASALSQDVLINSAMNLSALESYKDLGSQGLIAASGESAALTDIQLNGTTTGVFMGKYLPVFASFIFMIMIAAFPFMFAFALMPGGFQILVQFVKTLAWISLWSPMAAILNFFIDYRLMERFKESTAGPLTILADSPPVAQLTNLSSEAAFMAGLAGYLYLMVPALSWMLVTGSGVMLSNMTQSLGGAFQAHGNAGAVEEAATAKGAAEQKDTSVAEMQYYRSGAKMAAASSEFGAQKNVYGDNFGQMSSDMEKRGTASMAEQRGAGSMMTIDSAMAGGMASGKISGAHTTAMGQAYSGVSDQEFAGAASFEARQSASATRATSVENSITSDAQMQAGANMQARERGAAIRSADDVLKEHGGLDKYGQNKEALAVKGAMSEATDAEATIANLSDPNRKADIRQGMRNAAEKSISGLEGSGKNQTTAQAHTFGFQSAREGAVSENKMGTELSGLSDADLNKAKSTEAKKHVKEMEAVADSRLTASQQADDFYIKKSADIQSTHDAIIAKAKGFNDKHKAHKLSKKDAFVSAEAESASFDSYNEGAAAEQKELINHDEMMKKDAEKSVNKNLYDVKNAAETFKNKSTLLKKKIESLKDVDSKSIDEKLSIAKENLKNLKDSGASKEEVALAEKAVAQIEAGKEKLDMAKQYRSQNEKIDKAIDGLEGMGKDASGYKYAKNKYEENARELEANAEKGTTNAAKMALQMDISRMQNSIDSYASRTAVTGNQRFAEGVSVTGVANKYSANSTKATQALVEHEQGKVSAMLNASDVAHGFGTTADHLAGVSARMQMQKTANYEQFANKNIGQVLQQAQLSGIDINDIKKYSGNSGNAINLMMGVESTGLNSVKFMAKDGSNVNIMMDSRGDVVGRFFDKTTGYSNVDKQEFSYRSYLNAKAGWNNNSIDTVSDVAKIEEGMEGVAKNAIKLISKGKGK